MNKSDEAVSNDLNIIKLEKGKTVNMNKALGSSKRLTILRLLSEKELNLSEIAEKINSTPQAVYHHLSMLEENKLVKVVREEEIKNMNKTIKFYKAMYKPNAINILIWAPLEEVEITELRSRIPIAQKPVERIVRKMADRVFSDVTEHKIEILTSVVKNLVDLSHESMNSLKEEYGLEIDEKLWNLLLLFSNLSTMNAVKKMVENEDLRAPFEDLISLLCEESIYFEEIDS